VAGGDASPRRGLPGAPSRALDTALAGLGKTVSTLAVGLSGGPDSIALACCAAQYARTHRLSLHFFHVDHGLLPQAGAWARTAEQAGLALGVPVHVVRVQVDTASGTGIEAAARDARYAALSDLAQRHGADVVLLAHHQDDVAETVLFRLLRGSGVDGVRGMRAAFDRHGVTFLRPWLALPRAPLRDAAQRWAADHGVVLADDPSNLDVRHARGALRRDVLPAIATHWPGYRDTLTRFARQAAAAADVLQEVAEGDLAAILAAEPGNPAFGPGTRSQGMPVPTDPMRMRAPEMPKVPHACVRLSGLLALSDARQAMALRAWLGSWDLPMPSDARLGALLRQLRTAGPDRGVVWMHAGCVVRRYRDQVTIAIDAAPGEHGIRGHAEPATAPVDIVWRGEASIDVHAFGGVLHVEPVASGIDPGWLRSGVLGLRPRRGGERMQLRAEAPSRTLKNLYQELGVPAWARAGLPLVYRGDQLIHAAGLGTDVRTPQSSPGVRLVWLPGHPGVAFTA
jgi:tRNA(Ile)-lysidine synthase